MTALSIRNCRSSLFWGALRLEQLTKDDLTNADIVCIDLEDAVPPDKKDLAREQLNAYLLQAPLMSLSTYIVRINALDSSEGQKDIDMLLQHSGYVSYLLIPKLESISALQSVSRLCDQAQSQLGLLGIIETAQGLERVSELTTTPSRLEGFYFGGFDLSNAIGCEMDWQPLLYARSRLVHAAALRNLLVMDSPPPFVDESEDQQQLREYCQRSRALGMMGMVTKHPSQSRIIREMFSPSEDQIEKARKIISLYEADPSKPVIFEGKLIELPMIKKLQKLL